MRPFFDRVSAGWIGIMLIGPGFMAGLYAGTHWTPELRECAERLKAARHVADAGQDTK